MSTRVRSLIDLLRLFIGPGLWFVHFIVLYGAEALICTPPVTSARAMTWIASAATIVVLGALAGFAWALVRQPPPADRPEEHTGAAFLYVATLMLAVLSALGVGWTALPVALLPVCAPPAG
jgi:cytosine/uracil/thiamine/allantoin permease